MAYRRGRVGEKLVIYFGDLAQVYINFARWGVRFEISSVTKWNLLPANLKTNTINEV